ncbi:hypothetical protein [Chryseobacterium profundimaris]|uniref:Uncharacterized protein n=1 Tax=Chryseobacterium profundimaris TaxID=1387275 RepID=A0ABY1NZU9_9FLAO|nr:hypothetical protein [Chryseobacterium profundimaris]SMP22541.1 hypothetical protein SAMN06264346_106212 [Chryseobacterium profundimaris]
MKKIIICILFISISCKEKITLIERKILYSNLYEPNKNIYIELLSYYPALNKNQSNFYIVKNIHNNDTLYVVDKDMHQVSDFIEKYNGVENTGIVLRKSNINNKHEYFLYLPKDIDLSKNKMYLGELINLID